MRILLTGAGGQTAISLKKALDGEGEESVGLAHRDLDICDAAQVRDTVRSLRPDLVINTAALRRPDSCEVEPERAFAVNALGARNLALACAEEEVVLLHVSTDYVFDGRKNSPYLEEDAPNPLNVYGVSKLAGELFVKQIVDRHYIVRTSALFGGANDPAQGSNFVLTLLRRAAEGLDTHVVTDQRMSPTYTSDLARKISWLIRRDAYGVCHITNRGDCTWYEFAQAVFKKAGLRSRLLPTTTDALASPARRLQYSVLGHGMLERLGSDDLPDWENALERYLHILGRLQTVATPANHGLGSPGPADDIRRTGTREKES